ncbi:MAG: putative membrane protein [Marivirga sp.]|jgi:putative membrane protein
MILHLMDKLKTLRKYLLNRPWIGAVTIAAFYFFGTFGILIGYGDWFIPKTAFNLLLSFIVLLVYQQTINYKLIVALASCYLIGFTAEFLGVQYGLIFGDYYYPSTLGPQLFGVPFVIGVNWYLITFTVWSVLSRIVSIAWLRVFLAASITTLVDVLIEPVAIALKFWTWDTVEVPLQNYLGWFVISLLIFSIYQAINITVKNKMAPMLLAWQLFFFIVLNLFLP